MNIEEPDELLNWLNAQFIADVQKRHGDTMEYTIIWAKGKYAIRKYSENYYILWTESHDVEIYKDNPEDEIFVSDVLHFMHIPQYVRNALKKHIGEII